MSLEIKTSTVSDWTGSLMEMRVEVDLHQHTLSKLTHWYEATRGLSVKMSKMGVKLSKVMQNTFDRHQVDNTVAQGAVCY